MSEQHSSDDKAAVDAAMFEEFRHSLEALAFREGFAAGRAAQVKDDLAVVEAVLARSHNAGWQHACEEILRRITESGSSEENQ